MFTNSTPVFDVGPPGHRQGAYRVESAAASTRSFPTAAGNDAVLTGEITSITVIADRCSTRSSRRRATR